MSAAVIAQLVAAARFVEKQIGETVTIASISYPCAAAGNLAGSFEYAQGGALDMQHIPVCVLKADLAVQPAVNTAAVFRGVNLRVKSVNDDGLSWEIYLVQEFA